jgi:DNA helicase-2/ATP-dependent DNA helicase PcrA
MSQEKNPAEEFVFEFYDDDYAESLEKKEPEIIEKYKDVDFKGNLNEEQLEIVNNIKGPMLIIAGAGSGKTRTIVYSVAKLLVSGVKPSEIMLVTFTNKAAKEMIKRVEILLGKRPKGIWAGTFHSMGNRFLRKYAKTLGLKPNFTIMDQTDSKGLMKLAINQANVKEFEERFPSSAVAKNILSFSINCNKTIREVILWKYPQFDNDKIITKLKEVLNIYKAKKARDNLVDFDDLLVFWNRLLDERMVAKSIAQRIKYVLVDEYQDTNYIQDEIISKIVKENPNQNVMAVGDDAQSIYAFRGANFENILNFEKKYKDCKRYVITYNYRSVPQILDLANNSIKHNKKQHKKNMKPARTEGETPFQVNVGDEWEQARFITSQVLKLRTDDYKFSEMAVLCRAAFHLLQIELELQAKNIPYEVRAGVAFFEKAHIKDLLANLRIIENPYDEIAWSRVFSIIPGIGSASAEKIFRAISSTSNPLETLLNKSFFTTKMKGGRIPEKGRKRIILHAKNLIDFTSQDAPEEIIKSLVKTLEDHIRSKYENWQERIDDLTQLGVYAQKYPTIRRFLETLSLNVSSIESKSVRMGLQTEDEKPLVLSTIHRAKGLEWRVVFIPMLCEDFFPSSRVIGDADAYEEERRVFYVATTRAKDQLYLVSPSMVRTYRGHQTSRLSQFITELKPNVYQKSSVQFKSSNEKKKKKNKDLKPTFISAFDIKSNG